MAHIHTFIDLEGVQRVTDWKDMCDECNMNAKAELDFQVTERDYSWGTHVSLYRNGKLIMFVDLYKGGNYHIYENTQEVNK